MKTWITYLVATFMGLATTLLLGQFDTYITFIQSFSSLVIQFGGFILFPIVLITFTSGIASLRKDKMGGRLVGATFVWTVLSSLILSLIGVALFAIMPISFPASSSAGAATSAVIEYIETSISLVRDTFSPVNPFYSMASTQNFLAPIVFIAFLFGYFLKPSSDVLRPAYVTINSFSEVMYKMSRAFTIYGFALVYIVSASFFAVLQDEATVFVAPRFVFSLVLLALVTIFAILPLIFAITTSFKENPYKILYRSLGAATAGLFSGNIFFATPISFSLSRMNLGVQKRVSSTSISLTTIFARGGSVMVSSFTIASLIYATTGTLPSFSLSIFIALCSTFVSFFSSLFLGFEVFFITYFTLKLLSIDLHTAEMSLVGILPLLCGIGTMIDVLIGMFTSATANIWILHKEKGLTQLVLVPYKNML
ncbi:MAG: cation:dicarboxylase symporter family transporter [Sphaerochaetaceae bacterium]|nr:cation:dicarboxylase symporter family transporter [Sphaerochaetaceae bacterium]MDC7237176.1 cation:dicarboxylase symporter family transporter [Sphaerochaetaceae bacterium]MDC7250191.1 cation:dicarboxylase symporter family transporter [Sphaerochaetaceae bacterium]